MLDETSSAPSSSSSTSAHSPSPHQVQLEPFLCNPAHNQTDPQILEDEILNSTCSTRWRYQSLGELNLIHHGTFFFVSSCISVILTCKSPKSDIFMVKYAKCMHMPICYSDILHSLVANRCQSRMAIKKMAGCKLPLIVVATVLPQFSAACHLRISVM